MTGFADPPNREQLLKAIAGNPTRLLTEPESQWLDFKAEPHLKPNKKTTDQHRFEIAKDVTAMANAGGGVIVYGVQEAIDPAQPRRTVGDLSPIAAGIVDRDQVYKTLREWVFPSSRLRVQVRERKVEGGSIWVLDIDEHPREELPFLVVREWPPGKEEKGPTRGHFTVYRRQGSSNFHVSPEEVYQWLYTGYQAGGSNGAAPGTPAVPPSPNSGAGDPSLPGSQGAGQDNRSPTGADVVLQDEFDALEVKEQESCFYIQLVPEGSGRLDHFFGREPSSLEQAIGMFSTVRPRAGFSPFSPYATTVRTTNNALRLGIPGKGGVSVQPNGLSTFVCCQGTLLWASERHAPPGSAIINPVALPECTIEAARFFISQVLSRWPKPTARYLWRAGLHGLGKPTTVFLPRGMPGDIPLRMLWDTPFKPNTSDDFDTEFIVAKEMEPAHLAFIILKEIFYRFGYSDSDIPFRAQTGDKLDCDALKRL